MSALRAALVGAILLCTATDAAAGRRPFIWTWDTETLVEGDLELEQWQWFVVREGGLGDAPADSSRSAWWWWWSPIIGLTDRLELAVPVEFKATRKDGFVWHDVVLELRYRIVDPPPEDGETFPWSLAVRGGVQQDFAGGRQILQQNVILALGRTEGMHVTIDLGFKERARLSLAPIDLTLGIGATSKRFGPLRFGGELFLERRLTPRDEGGFKDHYFLGPNLAYAKGRLWATFGIIFGLTEKSPDYMPRLIVAVAI